MTGEEIGAAIIVAVWCVWAVMQWRGSKPGA